MAVSSSGSMKKSKPRGFLDAEIFVDGRRAQFLSGYADGGDPTTAQAPQGALVIVPDFHRGGVPVNLEFVFRHLARHREDLGIAHRDDDGQMARHKRKRGMEQALGRGSVTEGGAAG